MTDWGSTLGPQQSVARCPSWRPFRPVAGYRGRMRRVQRPWRPVAAHPLDSIECFRDVSEQVLRIVVLVID